MVRVITGPAIGIIIGALLGFAYYRFIGCASGSCPITSNPWASMIYGAIMGYMVSGMMAGG